MSKPFRGTAVGRNVILTAVIALALFGKAGHGDGRLKGGAGRVYAGKSAVPERV